MKFWKFICSVSFIFILFSCGENQNVIEGEQKEFVADEAQVVDSTSHTAVFVSDSLKNELADYFSPELIIEIENYLTGFNLADTDTLLEKSYHLGISLFEKIENELLVPETDYLLELIEKNEFDVFSVQKDLTAFNGLLGPVMFGCQAECTEFEMSYDLIYLVEKSKLTKGNSDDDFFSLLYFVEGDLGYAGQFDFKVWDKQYWDYGGSHRLGDDTCLEVVKKLMDYKKKHFLFSDLIAVIHDNLFDSLSGGHSYEYSVEEVLAEYNRIFKLNYFLDDERNALQNQFDEIKQHPEKFQFNCEDGNCSFG